MGGQFNRGRSSMKRLGGEGRVSELEVRRGHGPWELTLDTSFLTLHALAL